MTPLNRSWKLPFPHGVPGSAVKGMLEASQGVLEGLGFGRSGGPVIFGTGDTEFSCIGGPGIRWIRESSKSLKGSLTRRTGGPKTCTGFH